jgi:PhzF family phenazine biosynthesis protein
MDKIPLYHVDAFATEPFAGNPAAVCILEKPYKDNVLKSIASEMNLSETAFLQKLEQRHIEDSRLFSLRWFTPETEVNLCGHATLATAAVLFHDVKLNSREVSFETRSGTLTARLDDKGILLDFPTDETTPFYPSQSILDALGIRDFTSAHYSRKTSYLLILLPNEQNLRDLKPDFEHLKSAETKDKIAGVIVTSRGNDPYDFVSRFFAPWLGINEDPVTGSAHTTLCAYWSKILGKKEMHAYQASQRGGQLTVKMLSPDRVGLIGNAVIVSKGELYLQ